MVKRQPMTAFDTFSQVGTFDSQDLAQRNDELEVLNQSLSQKTSQLEAEIAQLRGMAVTAQEKAELEEKVKALTAQLSQQGGEHQVPLRQICRNPFQPRTIFPDGELQAFANCLKEDGQNTPVILIPLEEDTKAFLWSSFRTSLFSPELAEAQQEELWQEVQFMLFDGERRWRSASLLHWPTLRSVFKSGSTTTQLDLMEIQSDALRTTLHRQKLHPLNLAEVLVNQILHYHPDFPANPGEPPAKAVVRVLGAVVTRLERAKLSTQVTRIVDAVYPEQQAWLAELHLKPEEQAVMELILRYHLNPVSIDKNVFPLLALPADLKEAVQKTGVDRGRIIEIAKIKAERLGISESAAQVVRAEILQAIGSGELDRPAKVKLRVSQKLRELNPNRESTEQVPVEVQTVQKIKVTKLDRSQLEQLRSAMYAKLQEIELQIQGQ